METKESVFLVSCKTQYNDRGNMAQTDQLFMLIMMASFQICTVPGSDFTKKVSLSFFSKIWFFFLWNRSPSLYVIPSSWLLLYCMYMWWCVTDPCKALFWTRQQYSLFGVNLVAEIERGMDWRGREKFWKERMSYVSPWVGMYIPLSVCFFLG